MKIVIHGKRRLQGKVTVSGAKNAALPELAAVILSSGQVVLKGLPAVGDIHEMFRMLEHVGARWESSEDTVAVKIPDFTCSEIPEALGRTTRASILTLGPLLARTGYAKICLPGGCFIGDRKFNFHLAGLDHMGANVTIEKNYIVARARKLKGMDYTFPAKTVTGTENLLMAACLAEGQTVLRNCALEPEIGDLVELLISMGAIIAGKNSDTLTIQGQPSLGNGSHRVIPDRIEMGTYVIAGCLDDHDITVENAVPGYIRSLLDYLQKTGTDLQITGDTIRVKGNHHVEPMDVETQPYPGFPTDLQAQLTTLLTQARGVSRIHETIFNGRFNHCLELNKLGAQIEIAGDTSIIKGPTAFKGNRINSTDLRASAALVLAGLIAGGETVVENATQLFRGYENMPQKLIQLGAQIEVLGGSHE